MPLLKEIVPAEFQDREYLKPLLALEQTPETFAQVFKKLDGAESLLGKRPVIPGKDSKPEELEKFFEQFRAEKPEEYEIPTEKDAKRDEAFMKLVQKAFHDGSISKVQAQKFLSSFMPGVKEYSQSQAKTQALAKAKADQEFDTLAKAALGDGNKIVMERVRKAIVDYAPAPYKGQVDKLDDKNLVIMAGVIDAIMQKYVPADQLNGRSNSGSGGGSGDDIAGKRERAKTLLAEITKLKPMDPTIDEKMKAVTALYKEIAAAGV